LPCFNALLAARGYWGQSYKSQTATLPL